MNTDKVKCLRMERNRRSAMTDYSELIARFDSMTQKRSLSGDVWAVIQDCRNALEAQARTVADLASEVEAYRKTDVAKQDALNIMTAEVERLRKDARRYQFIRDGDARVELVHPAMLTLPHEAELDARIDAILTRRAAIVQEGK